LACPPISPTVLEEEEEPTGLLQRNNFTALLGRLEYALFVKHFCEFSKDA